MTISKAQSIRFTELVRAAQGKPTKRPVKEIILSEKQAAEKYIARPPAATTGTGPV